MSAWDMPRARREPSHPSSEPKSLLSLMPENRKEAPAPEPVHDYDHDHENSEHRGFLDITALPGLLVDKARLIIACAILLAIVLTGLFLIVPFPYKASAIVFVDPRDQKVTLQEEVLPAIGSDAAVLESMVQIVRSDGFLIDLMQKLGMLGGKAWNGDATQSEQLAKLRKQIQVDRMGATYLVDISYRASTGEEAARIANEVAIAFAAAQNGSRSDATQSASRALSDRLIEIRKKLNTSEEAVARYKAENNIVYIDQQNTVQMRQMTDLSQQLASIQNATEEAQARYSEGAETGTITRSTAQGNDESEQLAFLRRQMTQLEQTRDQQMQNLGSRHPRLLETQRMIDGLRTQIDRQSTRMVGQLRSERDINVSKQEQLQKQIDELGARIAKTEETKVQLAALEREAAADRAIYEQLLNRNKATYELAFMPTDNVRVVSPAVVPLKSTRPPLALLLPVIAFLSLVLALGIIVVLNLGRLRQGSAR